MQTHIYHTYVHQKYIKIIMLLNKFWPGIIRIEFPAKSGMALYILLSFYATYSYKVTVSALTIINLKYNQLWKTLKVFCVLQYQILG